MANVLHPTEAEDEDLIAIIQPVARKPDFDMIGTK
jgi:hypothetical protein